METFLFFIAGLLVAFGAAAFGARNNYSSDTKVIIRRKNDKLVVEAKNTYVLFDGTHTFELKENGIEVEIEFETKKKGGKKVRGPFAEKKGGERGKYRLTGASKVENLTPDIDPGLIRDKWKFTVKDPRGQEIDPGLRVKR